MDLPHRLALSGLNRVPLFAQKDLDRSGHHQHDHMIELIVDRPGAGVTDFTAETVADNHLQFAGGLKLPLRPIPRLTSGGFRLFYCAGLVVQAMCGLIKTHGQRHPQHRHFDTLPTR
ncbi:hypothetical protein D3C87_1846160 [compost metagenome]